MGSCHLRRVVYSPAVPMKTWGGALFSAVVLTVNGSALAGNEGRFDAQVARPLAAPRDLVMVPKSEVIGHLSPVLGVFWDVAFDPLALAIGGTSKTLDVIGARLQITPLLGIGFFDWLEVTAAIPLVAWQTSENLRTIGTEGQVRSSSFGDIRLQTKVALPFFNRKEEVKSGFGMAVAGNVNLPTGDPLAFTGDGMISGGAQVIMDYRFNLGLIVATNLGVWIRPEHQFAGIKIGDMAQFGVAAEMYVVQRWGLSVIGEVYGYPSLTKFPDGPDQVPAEVLLGLRWQTQQGITITVGGSFGAACGFGAPAIRLFNSITWQPKSSNEQHEITRLQQGDRIDPDGDGLIEPEDRCPGAAGTPRAHGCPANDRDGDGVVDQEDQCPELASPNVEFKGCPLARVEGETITAALPITFEPNSAELTSSAQRIVTAVRQVLDDTPTIRELLVEVHTDARESDEASYNLSQERAENVAYWMLQEGIAEDRIWAKGHGHTRPAIDDSDCLGPDEELSRVCQMATAINRRVVFRILRWGAPVPWPILAGDGPSRVLPMKPAVLQQGRVLPDAKDAEGKLPDSAEHHLPAEGVLPKEDGTPPSPPQ